MILEGSSMFFSEGQCYYKFSPCIMCVQYCGRCSVLWGDILSTVGVFSTMGDILSTVGVFITVGDIMSTMGVILSTVGVILSTMGDVQYRGGYHDARGGYHDARGGYHEYRGGCSVPWGKSLLLFEYPMVLEHPHGIHDIPPHVS